ncbi:Protochlorophyllide reductase A, chloroplastic [Seminavis robusta]|uniref:Protochlorophyllide reductase A, chloroplastic n=1 Tax=Seminavis robusta TaxID=568900 RepID=A0A9N8EIS0_9STRA|nr:Protochlorophyllide reductase A, chloroplastic [Seminavis robusta]|eukprot:Sro1240_g255360.1 Protochlorophyllide reductase A, chloroplastic (338) ;mRNA; r:28370-29383
MSLEATKDDQQRRCLHILITGSSQGVGLAAAKQLIAEGHTVYHACRSDARAQHAAEQAGGGVALKACNLSDFDSVKAFAQDVQTRVHRLDVVCLNAGMSPSTSIQEPPFLTQQGYEPTIGVNHLGHFLLAHLLLDKLMASAENPRLVLTASSVHDPSLRAGQSGGKTATLGGLSGLGVNLKQNPQGPTMVDGSTEYSGAKVYKDSKLCNILMCRQAATGELFPKTLTTCCFNPGFVPTTGLFESLRQESWWKAKALTLLASIIGFSIPVEVAGARLVTMATHPDIPNGSYYCAADKSKGATPEEGFVVTNVSEDASNDALAEALWKKSMEIVKPWLE